MLPLSPPPSSISRLLAAPNKTKGPLQSRQNPFAVRSLQVSDRIWSILPPDFKCNAKIYQRTSQERRRKYFPIRINTITLFSCSLFLNWCPQFSDVNMKVYLHRNSTAVVNGITINTSSRRILDNINNLEVSNAWNTDYWSCSQQTYWSSPHIVNANIYSTKQSWNRLKPY